MRETQRNIKRYKEQLGDVKYKIFSVGIMFVISICMLTTASFAWITLSTHPEVTGISTTIAGNGNLEIALASSDEAGALKFPEKSQAGDGSITNILEKNITWGNLVNLGSSEYGLHHISLKPASLYKSNLSQSPLAAVKYNKDGRVERLDASGLRYTNYDKTVNNNNGAFVASSKTNYGVRAISSTLATNTEAIAIQNKVNNIRSIELQKVKDSYDSLIDNNIGVVAELMGKVMEEKLNNSEINFINYLDDIIRLMDGLGDCYKQTFDVYASIINMQLEQEKINVEPYTGKMIYENKYNTSYFEKLGINKNDNYNMLKDLDKLINDYYKLVNYTNDLKAKESSNVSSLYWSDISGPVVFLVDIDSCKIDNDKTIAQLSSSMSQALGLLDGGTHQGTITKGALKDFEQITGAKMAVTGQKISVKYIVTVSIKANIETSAKAPYSIDSILDDLEAYLNNGAPLTEKATDIYGMVLDFFLRTNAKDANIILEGETVTEKQIQTITVDNKTYDCYEYLEAVYYFIPSSGTKYSGSRDFDGKISSDEINYLKSGKFYSFNTGQELSVSSWTQEQQTKFYGEITWSLKTVVIGYDGENRVWEESENMIDGKQNATQGKGSCYIFYPESVTEQEQMLALLKGLTVVFLDQESNYLTSAKLNTEKAYETSGKVIVPLELTLDRYMESNDEQIPYITTLTQNETTFISAIVYIDGNIVTNDLVDAAGGVTGYLNLQFGTDLELNPMEDEKLQDKTISITAGLGENNATSLSMTYGQDQLTTSVNVNISGVTGNDVHVNFIRELNTSQGVVMQPVTLLQTDSGSWSGNMTFESPGDYILRSVWIDGVEYEFNNNQTLRVSIEGLSIENLWLDKEGSSIYLMTSDNKYTTNAYVTFGANDAYVPKDVKGLFITEDNEVITVSFNKDNSGNWKSSVSFDSSGRYTLSTLLVDGDPVDVPEQLKKTIILYLGIDANVKLSSLGDVYQGKPKTLTATVNITEENDQPMSDLTNVYLRYNMSGSTTNSAIAKVEWNSSKKCYEGEITFKTPGVYEFYSIGINKTVVSDDELEDITLSNYLYEAEADSFSFITMDPPKYKSESTVNYQFAPNDDAKFVLNIANSMSAKVEAEVYNTQSGKTLTTTGSLVSTNDANQVSEWNFVIPQSSVDSSQNGDWKLNKINLSNVYVDGILYVQGTEHEYYTIDLSEENISTYVVNDIKLSLTNNSRTAFEKKDFTYSIASAESTTDNSFARTGYKLVVTDYHNNAVNTDSSKGDVINIDVKSLIYDFVLDGNVKNWWANYTNFGIADGGSQSYEYSFINNDISRVGFAYAGTYTPRLEVSVNDYQYTIIRTSNTSSGVSVTEASNGVNLLIVNDNFVSVEKIEWNKPNIDIISATQSTSGSDVKGNNSISSDKKSATVYYRSTTTGSGCNKNTTYYPSTVTLELSNSGVYSSAQFDISGDSSGCGGSYEKVFDFKSANTSSLEIGDSNGTTASNIKGNTLTIISENKTFNILVDEISIIMGDD